MSEKNQNENMKTSNKTNQSALLNADKEYVLKDTRIEKGGVFKCCLATVATEYEGQTVKIGMKSKCKYCNETFTLVDNNPFPVWKPD